MLLYLFIVIAQKKKTIDFRDALGDPPIGELGWCSSERTPLPSMQPGFDSRSQRHMWVEFVVGSSR